MDEMQKVDNTMEIVTAATDAVTASDNQAFLKGSIAGLSLATVLVAGYHWLAKPLVRKARIKLQAAKAKRAARSTGGDVPSDIEQEYPIGK